MFYQLSLALAREMYPEPKKRGRPSKWTSVNKGVLVVEIERLIDNDDQFHGIEWACAQLAKREPWVSFLETKDGDFVADPAEALRQVYFASRSDKWATVARGSFKYHEYMGTVDTWDKEVFDCVKKS